MKIRTGLVFLAALVLLTVFSGCSKKASQSAGTVGERNLTVAIAAEPVHFVPFDSRISGDIDHLFLYNVYDTLLYKDTRDGSVKPWIATNWEISPDGLQIKFKIRDDVYFQDGTKLTAEDIKFTYDNTKKYPIGNALLINYDYIEVIDEHNFIVHMTHPYNAILNSFCSRAAFILSKAHWDKVGGLEGYKKAPIGTGAYKFVSATSGDSQVFERNEKYWAGLPAFKNFTIKIITDVNTQVLALESGDVDVIFNTPIDNLQLLKNPSIAWDAVGSNATHFLAFFNNDRSPLGLNENFRRAVQYAIDKNAINTAVFGGKAVTIDIYGSPAFTARPQPGSYTTYTRDLAKAKEYLAASGYAGQEFRVVCIAGTANQKSAEVIQGQLQQVGINMRIVATDSATFMNTTQSTGDFDAQLVIHNSSVMDCDSLYLYYAKERYDFKDSHFKRGDEMNQLVTQARQDPDNNRRVANYARVSSIVNEDAYAVYLLMDLNTIAYKNHLKQVRADMAKYYRVFEWSY